jgi:glucose-6-phosphate 1-epimerase
MREEDLVRIQSPEGAAAVIHLQGAHVLSWLTPGGKERLYLSPAAVFRQGVAVRGGVPVVFPQFSGLGPLPKHGFARTERWQLLETGAGWASLLLKDNETTRALWPFAFELVLAMKLAAASLVLELKVHNTGTEAFPFMAALHPYFAVADVLQTQVTGLQRLRYTDDVTMLKNIDGEPVVSFGTDVDRLYHDAGGRVLRVAGYEFTQSGFADSVIWNPGPVTGAKIQDLAQPEGWRSFVCVEAAQVVKPMLLAPGAEWYGTQQVRCVD